MRVAFLSLGCKVNYYETEKMKEIFQKEGHVVVDFEEDAEIYIINTCTVTNIADRKSRKMIHRARRRGESAFVAVTGCYADSSEIKGEREPDVDLFVSNQEKEKLYEKVMEAYEGRNLQADRKVGDEEGVLSEAAAGMGLRQQKPQSGQRESATGQILISEAAAAREHTRAFLTVQSGCNQYCTYCIIPYVRGPLRSRAIPEVVHEVEQLVSEGFLEVVVTGIHLSSYGVDFTDKKNFLELEGKPLLELLRAVAGVEGIRRIRLGSLEPRIITEAFSKELSKIWGICPQFHLSLQSGCDSVLKRMNRHYTAAEYAEKVEILRKYFDHPAITTDIIVGFPGETEEEFQTTLQFVRDIRFSRIHVFKYSRRKGTMADAMEGQVPEPVKAERSGRLIELAQKLEEEYGTFFLGKQELVLFEEVVEFEGKKYLTGYNERYVRIAVEADEETEVSGLVNEIVSVKPEKVLSFQMLLGKA